MSVVSWKFDSQVEISINKTFGNYEYCEKLKSNGIDRPIHEWYEAKFTEVHCYQKWFA